MLSGSVEDTGDDQPTPNPLWERLNRTLNGLPPVDGELSDEEWEFLSKSTLETLRDDEPVNVETYDWSAIWKPGW